MNPLVIIGAPRSGTNMLRDILVDVDGFSTWPCDEINYIWRHHNRDFPTDEFTREMASEDVKTYIRGEFDKYAKTSGCKFLVEKTCASSLRVDFIDEIFPEAKFIFLVRDGRDTVGSAVKRWKAKLDIKYLVKKVRYVPPTDIPYYAIRYIRSRLYKFVSSEKRIGIWGPKFEGMDRLLSEYSLEEVSAMQWQRCVDSSEWSFKKMTQSRVLKINYESFVKSPVDELGSIAKFLNVDISCSEIDRVTANVTETSVGKGVAQLGVELIKKIETCVGSTLQKQGYL